MGELFGYLVDSQKSAKNYFFATIKSLIVNSRNKRSSTIFSKSFVLINNLPEYTTRVEEESERRKRTGEKLFFVANFVPNFAVICGDVFLTLESAANLQKFTKK